MLFFDYAAYCLCRAKICVFEVIAFVFKILGEYSDLFVVVLKEQCVFSDGVGSSAYGDWYRRGFSPHSLFTDCTFYAAQPTLCVNIYFYIFNFDT